MNEKEAQKELVEALGAIQNLGETRDKMICHIDDLLDRIKANRRTPPPPSKEAEKVDETFTSLLKRQISYMDLANEKLDQIICRLSELV